MTMFHAMRNLKDTFRLESHAKMKSAAVRSSGSFICTTEGEELLSSTVEI
jgi:hypothetical protein